MDMILSSLIVLIIVVSLLVANNKIFVKKIAKSKEPVKEDKTSEKKIETKVEPAMAQPIPVEIVQEVPVVKVESKVIEVVPPVVENSKAKESSKPIIVPKVSGFNFRVRKPIPYKWNMILSFSFAIIVLLVWWFLTSGETIESRKLSPLILPNPVEVVKAFPKLHFEQGLMRGIITSLQRVTAGFSIGVSIAFVIGILMSTYSSMKSFFKLFSLVSSYVPIVAFVPLTLAWWGGTEKQKVGFLAISCLIAFLPMVISAVENVNDAYLDAAKTRGASQVQLVTHVLIPIAMADIWQGLRTVYGIGWTWIILAELVNAQSGLGHLIFVSERRSQTASIFAIILVIIGIAVLCDKIWTLVGDQLFPYRKKS